VAVLVVFAFKQTFGSCGGGCHPYGVGYRKNFNDCSVCSNASLAPNFQNAQNNWVT
jgi:hypothetical protein